jgi:peptide/nickel transport system substrate-binding protein
LRALEFLVIIARSDAQLTGESEVSRGKSRTGRARATAFCCLLLWAPACQRSTAPNRSRSIRIAAPYELNTLDPYSENTVSAFSLLSNIYEPLVATDRDMAVRPALAESWDTPDPLTWVFHLRPSVAFQSGKPFRAADVVYSLTRLMNNPSLSMRSFLLNVSEVREREPLAVEIHTRRPTKLLSKKLCFVLIMPEGATEATLTSAADGTGPYSLANWRPGDRALLRRNQRYWGAPPAVEEVEFELARDPNASIQGLLSGRYQLIQADSKELEQRVSASPRHEVLRQDNIYVKYLAYDLTRAVTPYVSVTPNPLRNRDVRQALSLGIDKERLVAALPNPGVAASQPVPRFIFGFDPDRPPLKTDIPRSRQLLQKAGLSQGFDVVLHTRHMYAAAAKALKDQFADIGIRVDVKPLPDAEFFAAVSRRDSSLWLSRVGCPTGDASDFLEVFVHSPDRIRHLGDYNAMLGSYSNLEVDRGIESLDEIEALGDRRQRLQGLLGKVMDDLVEIPLYSDQDGFGIDRSLSWRPRSDSYIRIAEISWRE